MTLPFARPSIAVALLMALWLPHFGCNETRSVVDVLGQNPCGGDEILPSGFSEGGGCESRCGGGTWVCNAGHGICRDDGVNECGTCSELQASPGDVCGACDQGHWECDETGLACVGARELNACGGCTVLSNESGASHGASCGPCGRGTLRCDGLNELRCDGPAQLNECGGCDELLHRVGDVCGDCQRGRYDCVDSSLACVDSLEESDRDSDGIPDDCDCDFVDPRCDGGAICVEEATGVACECESGSERDAVGVCAAIDECSTTCSPLVHCIDRVGFAECGSCSIGLEEGEGGCCSSSPFGLGAGGGCVILEGRVKCWGGDNKGCALGYNEPSEDGECRGFGDEPGQMGDALPFLNIGGSVTVAIDHELGLTCVLSALGEVRCWGANSLGQLGQGDANDRGDDPDELGTLPPIDVGTGRRVVQFANSREHVCVLLDNYEIKCWGANARGQLGQGHDQPIGLLSNQMGDGLPPVELPPGVRPVKVVVTDRTSCVLTEDGEVYCWGDAAEGGLGVPGDSDIGTLPGHMGSSLRPVQLGPVFAVDLDAGWNHACVLLSDSQIKCFGDARDGRLGLESSDTPDTSRELGENLPFVDLGDGVVPVSLHLGGHHSCARLLDNRLKCWGRNVGGQAGQPPGRAWGNDPGEMGDNLPYVNLGDREIHRIGAGDGLTCVLFTDGTTSCFGSNFGAGLGLGHDDSVEILDAGYFAMLPEMDFGTDVRVGCSP